MRADCSGGRRLRLTCPELRGLAAHTTQRPADRVVCSGRDALLQRDDSVVGDVDVLRTHVRAALGDVAEAKSVLLADELRAVVSVQGMHLERCESYEEARAREALLVLVVVADDVADVLAQEALDALVELLHALDV